MNKSKGELLKLGKEKPGMIYNQVWEVTCMTWPTPIPDKMNRTIVKLGKIKDLKGYAYAIKQRVCVIY